MYRRKISEQFFEDARSFSNLSTEGQSATGARLNNNVIAGRINVKILVILSVHESKRRLLHTRYCYQ